MKRCQAHFEEITFLNNFWGDLFSHEMDFGLTEKAFLRESHFSYQGLLRMEIFTFHSHSNRTMNFHISAHTMRHMGSQKAFGQLLQNEHHFTTDRWFIGASLLLSLTLIKKTLSKLAAAALHAICWVIHVALGWVRSQMNRGWTQFADAAVWEWTHWRG